MKTLNDVLNLLVVIHWWNFKTKTLDFKGTLKECLKDRDITYRKRKYKDQDGIYLEGYYTWTFKYKQGHSEMIFKMNGRIQDFARIAKKIISFQLIYLGDKSQVYIQNFGTNTINK